MAKPNGHSVYVFDGFRLDGDRLMLYRGELPTALPPKAVETLAILVRSRGEIISKEELIDAVWKGSIVEDSNLTQYLYLIRKTLGTRENGKPYIETLRKRGYVFDSDTFEVISEGLAREPVAETEPTGSGQNILAFTPRGTSRILIEDNAQAQRTGSRRIALVAAVQMAMLISVIGAVAWFNSGAADANDDQGAVEFLRLTDGIEPNDAAISPDGKYFAYTELDGARSRMWIQQTGQSNRQEVVPWMNKWIGPKIFSPDSQFIYYTEGDAAVGNTLYRVPAFGGPPVKILSGINGPISFGPGGREFVFNRHLNAEKVSQIVIRETDGTGAERVVFSWNDQTSGANVAWSPDGKTIALASGTIRDLGGNCTFYALGADGTNLNAFSNEKWESCYRIAWRPDGKGIYAITTKDGDGYSTRRDQLYFISYPGGHSRRVTVEGSRHQVASLTVTDNGDVLVIPFNRVSQIWAMDSSGDVRTAVQITKGLGDGRAGIAPTGDGRVAYIARTGENLSIWTMYPDGSDQRQLTTEPQSMEELRSGGDGKSLFFSVPHGRQNDLYRVNSDGTEMRQVTRGLKVIDSGVSHDGKWIVYSGATVSGFSVDIDLWKMPVDGGESIRLGVRGCDMPHFSPDDKLISCVEDQARVKILSAADGKVLKTFDLLPRSTVNFGARWAPDGKSLVYIVGEKDVSNLWLHPIDGSAPRRLTDFTAGSIYHFVYSLDGKQLYVARGTQIRDAVLVASSKRQ